MEDNNSSGNIGRFDIRDIYAIIMNNIIKILIVGVLFGLIANFITHNFIQPVYQSDATVVLKIANTADTPKVTYNDILLTQQLVDTYSYILKSDALMAKVIADVSLKITLDQLRERLKISGVKNTQIITVSIQDNDPNMAMKIVNKVIEDAPKVVNKNSEGANIEAVNAAKKGDLVYPIPFLNTVLAFIFGVLLIVGIEVLKEYLDDTVKSDEQVRQMFGIPVLGLLPEIKYELIKEAEEGDKKK